MTIQHIVLSPLQKFKEIIRDVVLELLPGAGGGFGAVSFGRIIRVNDGMGRVDDRAKGWSADIQILRPDLSDNADIDPIKDVAMDPDIYGGAVCIFGKPAAGMICRVGFMYNHPGHPFILSVTGEGRTLPGAGAPLHPGQVPGETFIDTFLRHTHLNQGLGMPTSNISATLPPGGPILKSDLQG